MLLSLLDINCLRNLSPLQAFGQFQTKLTWIILRVCVYSQNCIPGFHQSSIMAAVILNKIKHIQANRNRLFLPNEWMSFNKMKLLFKYQVIWKKNMFLCSSSIYGLWLPLSCGIFFSLILLKRNVFCQFSDFYKLGWFWEQIIHFNQWAKWNHGPWVFHLLNLINQSPAISKMALIIKMKFVYIARTSLF
jgi:hypothetical protein